MKQIMAIATVKRTFKYDGKEYRPGDIFEPKNGDRRDLQVILSPSVNLSYEFVDPPKKKTTRRKTTRSKKK